MSNYFTPGAVVARYSLAGAGNPVRYHRDQVLRVHANGNFTLKSEPRQQWRPDRAGTPHAVRTGGTYRREHVVPWDEGVEAEVRRQARQRDVNRKVAELREWLAGALRGGDYHLTEEQVALVDQLLASEDAD